MRFRGGSVLVWILAIGLVHPIGFGADSYRGARKMHQTEFGRVPLCASEDVAIGKLPKNIKSCGRATETPSVWLATDPETHTRGDVHSSCNARSDNTAGVDGSPSRRCSFGLESPDGISHLRIPSYLFFGASAPRLLTRSDLGIVIRYRVCPRQSHKHTAFATQFKGRGPSAVMNSQANTLEAKGVLVRSALFCLNAHNSHPCALVAPRTINTSGQH